MIFLGFAILAWLLTGCVLLYLDVRAECRHQAELDLLWDSDADLADSC
jgi:hypothetical protein